jgi:hypothetical protein
VARLAEEEYPMPVDTKYIPQADTMATVLRVVEAVSEGHHTFQELARVIAMDPRQGRYYRLASELLGLTIKSGLNYSELTVKGREYLQASRQDKLIILQEAIVKNPFFGLIVEELKQRIHDGINYDELKNIIKGESATTTEGMLDRRTHTVINWLKYSNIMNERRGAFYLNESFSGPAVVEIIEDPTRQILMPSRKLRIFSSMEGGAGDEEQMRKTINYLVDQGKTEKANLVHKRLVYQMAGKIKRAGGEPKTSDSVDLATIIGENKYIFEMKSITAENAHGQIRKAVSQLYEYRYLHDLPEAKLCIVIEKKLPRDKEWLLDYLIGDRRISICWRTNGGFDTPESCKSIVGKFMD